MELLLIASLCILCLSVFLFIKRPKNASDKNELLIENEKFKIAIAVAEQNLKNAQSEASRINDLIKEEKQDNEFKLLGRINRLEEEKQDLLDSLNIEKQQNSTITANLLSEKEKLEEQKQHIDSLQQKFKVEFENI